jgi:hypothetical protein
MELNSVVNIIVEKNNKKFTFGMPVGANYGESYDACFECLMKITELSREAAAQMEQKAPKASEATGE